MLLCHIMSNTLVGRLYIIAGIVSKTVETQICMVFAPDAKNRIPTFCCISGSK